MALPVIAFVYRCAVIQSLGSERIVNVIHLRNGDAPPASDVAEAMANAWGDDTGLVNLQSNDLNLLRVDCIQLDGTSPTVSASFATADNQTGKDSGDAVPAQVAGIFTLRSGTRGRSHRGRVYIGGMAQSFLDDPATAWSPTTVGGANTVWGQFTTALEGFLANTEVCVASYKLASAEHPVSADFRSYLGTQHRRARPVA